MAKTSWATGLQVSRWAQELFYEAGKEIYFDKMMGDGPDSLIQVKHELDGVPGKDITFGLVTNLNGAGVSGDNTLEGNEETLNSHSQTISTSMVRNAIRSNGKFQESKALFDFRLEAMSLLKTWLAETIDSAIFTSLSSSPTRNLRADNGGDAISARTNQSTFKSNLAAADVISLDDISALKKLAKIPAGSTEMRMRPVRIDGNEYYVLIVHPEVAYDLRKLSSYVQIQREAQVRGDSNPLFTGAIGVYDGVIIHEHENIETFDDGGGASVHGHPNLFLGAQAGLFARVGTPMWIEKTFDYGNQLGISGGLIYGTGKSLFNSEDYSTIAYYTASTDFTP
tara:strand:- start:5039 stop:6055 length:1017 start_codon:yes stop_codon:yes gene_type:complete